MTTSAMETDVLASTVLRAAFIGDSYTQGVGASSPATRWVTLVATEEGWEPDNLGRGGTGYVTSAGREGCGLEYCPNYQEMVPQVVDALPDIVVVAGGQNDLGAFTSDPDAVTAGITATYTALREGLPSAEIIAVGPSTPRPPGATIERFDIAVRAAAATVGARFVNLLDPNVIAPAGVLPDGEHVSDAGHAAIAQRVEQEIGSQTLRDRTTDN